MPEETLRCRTLKESLGIRRMHILCVCVLFIIPGRSSALTGPDNITGRVGSTITIQCQYENEYRNDEKYWCRGWNRLSCSVVVESTRRRQHGRTSIRDNVGQHTFTVTMGNLREDDADYYWCGISVDGLDHMVSVNLTVIRGFSTVTPNADLSALPTEQGLPSFPDSTTEAPSSKSLEETTLKILLPIIVILLFLLLLTTALFFRERRRRKQDMESDVSKCENTHMPPDMSTLYAVIQKPDSADARTPCMENTARNTEPVGDYEEIQASQMVSDTHPIYAVVKKREVSRNHGIDNPTLDVAGSEHHYEEIHCSSVMPGSQDVACTTVPFTTTDHHHQQQHLYSTVEFAALAPSEEPQYYLLTK